MYNKLCTCVTTPRTVESTPAFDCTACCMVRVSFDGILALASGATLFVMEIGSIAAGVLPVIIQMASSPSFLMH